jgi:hypothetical protein
LWLSSLSLWLSSLSLSLTEPSLSLTEPSLSLTEQSLSLTEQSLSQQQLLSLTEQSLSLVRMDQSLEAPTQNHSATPTDNRPADCRTQRATITPATNKNTPAIKTNVEPPVSGKSHTSTANTTTPD